MIKQLMLEALQMLVTGFLICVGGAAGILLVVTLWSPCIQADTLYTGAWSTHIGGGDFNETHNLIAYHHEASGLIGGYFRNSYDEDAVFIGVRKDWRVPDTRLYLGAMIGAVYGYRDCIRGWRDNGRKVCAMVTANAEYRFNWARPAAFLLGKAAAAAPGWRLPW